ncbi:MAG: hypothetical protein KAU38_06950 [Desulfobacterales bacterium]|nr:hypothetical protein [Desulfobacterales bacterium]
MKNERKAWEGAEKMSLAKMERRQQLAKLPFKEKISIFLQLQSMARGISMASGRKCHEVWKCGESGEWTGY